MQTLHFCAFFKTEKLTSPVGYILTTERGKFLDMSATVQSLMGVTLDDMVSDQNISSWVDCCNTIVSRY